MWPFIARLLGRKKLAADPVSFWKWFVANADALRDSDARKTMLAISDELRKIDSGVFGEIGTDGDRRMLVITADGDKQRFQIVQRIYDARPSVTGWSIVAFRPRPSPDDAPHAIRMGGIDVVRSDVKFVAETGQDGKLDLTLYLPVDDEPARVRIGFLMLDHTLGEYDMETWIGGVDFAEASRAPADAKPLPSLPPIVDALKTD